MPEPLDQLERLAPEIDADAALTAFSAERRRRRRRRHTLAAAAAVLVALIATPALIALMTNASDDTTIAAGGEDDTTSTSPVDATSLDFDVLGVLVQTGEEMGTMRAALDAAEYSEMWESFGGQPPAPDFDQSFVLAITIPDDACPPTLERFATPENAFVPVFVEPDGGCIEPLIPKTFVVAVARAGLPDTVVFRLPADDVDNHPTFDLEIDLARGVVNPEVTTTRAPTDVDLPGKAVDIFPNEGAELAAVGLAEGEFLPVHALPTEASDVVAELLWDDAEIIATGRNRQVDDETWTELTFQGAMGWARTESLLQPLAGQDEIIDQLFPTPSERPTASHIGALALMVVNAYGQGPYMRVATYDFPDDTTAPGSLRIDIVNIGDDATGGVRLRITAEADLGGLVLASVERTDLCRRGVSEAGCV